MIKLVTVYAQDALGCKFYLFTIPSSVYVYWIFIVQGHMKIVYPQIKSKKTNQNQGGTLSELVIQLI